MLTHPTITILGDGGWGTTLLLHLARKALPVRLWGAFPEYVAFLDKKRENVKFLPGIKIPGDIPILASEQRALEGAGVVIVAVPAQHVRQVLQRVRPHLPNHAVIVNVAKGIEKDTARRMSEVICDAAAVATIATLSGPSIAYEVARGQPASVVLASTDRSRGAALQKLFMSEMLRVYTTDDCIGVELGGALKNPVAIAAGISDGLGFGSNAKAALTIRGMVEVARLGVALGARADTFWGLSGLGDLLTTCVSGRNRWLGEELAKGRAIEDILAKTDMVIEGVETTYGALALANKHNIDLPIIQQVHAIMFERKDPRVALKALMTRAPKHEANSTQRTANRQEANSTQRTAN
jgi:glycerol-3-phosphate dehydrogenase (NAD(P)+)